MSIGLQSHVIWQFAIKFMTKPLSLTNILFVKQPILTMCWHFNIIIKVALKSNLEHRPTSRKYLTDNNFVISLASVFFNTEINPDERTKTEQVHVLQQINVMLV